jgi:hypothetical protein
MTWQEHKWLMDAIDAIDYFSTPLWFFITWIAFDQFPGPRKRIWWLLAPAPLVLLPLLRVLLVAYAWGTRGFAP